MITLNQNIELLKNFALNHNQLNDFMHSQKWDVGASRKMQYPLMWCTYQGTHKTLNGAMSRKFVVDISDMVNKDKTNLDHVKSDCELIASDLVEWLEQQSNAYNLGITIDSEYDITDYEDDRDDQVAGVYFELTITANIGNYSCKLPITPGNLLDGNYIYIGGQSASTGCLPVIIKDQNGNVVTTVASGSTYTITVLTELDQQIGNTTGTIIQNILP